MNLFQISISDWETFLLILTRVGGILFAAPVFESRNIPAVVKIGLATALAMIFFPQVTFHYEQKSVIALAGIMLSELAIGLLIGLAARIMFAAVELAGQVIGFQMGLGIVSVFDPFTQDRTSLVAQFKNLIAMLLFFTFNAHHLFLNAVAKSYEFVPLAGMNISQPLVQLMINVVSGMFVLALQIGAPILAINMFVSVGLGIVARTVPQINVLIVSFPLTIGVGLFALGVSMPFVAEVLKNAFNSMGREIETLLHVIGKV
jgi:flagellar biosynthetic protein FliR